MSTTVIGLVSTSVLVSIYYSLVMRLLQVFWYMPTVVIDLGSTAILVFVYDSLGPCLLLLWSLSTTVWTYYRILLNISRNFTTVWYHGVWLHPL